MTASYYDDSTRVPKDGIPSPTFELGDRVYGLTIYKRDATEMCKVCNGTGKVAIEGSYHKAYCPEPGCRLGQQTVTRDQRFYSIRPLTIRQVSITLKDHDRSFYPERLVERTVRYMAEQTGVGSGQTWQEDRLFTYREAAVKRAVAHDAVDDEGWYLREDERARRGR